MAWPPTLVELKTDLKFDDPEAPDPRDDQLQQVLDAAVAWVEDKRPDFNYGDPFSELPDVTADVRLGTLRLAGRWHMRRRSPDGVVQMGVEMGAGTVPGIDIDIEKLLGLGRHGKFVFG